MFASPNGDVTASGTETIDNLHDNEPDYRINLHPKKATEFSFAMHDDQWNFSYVMKSLGDVISQGACDAGNPTMAQTDPFFEAENYLDWIMGGRQLASYATHVMSMISYSLHNVEPFMEWSNDDLRFDYDRYDDATTVSSSMNFPDPNQ